MKTIAAEIILFIVIASFLFVPVVSAYDIVSGVYEVISYHLGLAGDEPGSAMHDSRFTLTTGGSGELNSSDYSGNVGWFEEANVTAEEPEGPEETGRSGGDGATIVPPPACTYNWTCTRWFPFECPEEGFQERICMNRGTCNGTDQMPVQRQECEFLGPFEPLFDIFLEIPNEYSSVCKGSDVEASIRLVNFGKIELLDAYLTYWVIDENNKMITELKDTRAVKNITEYNIKLKLPSTVREGTYRVYAEIVYDVNKTALAADSFEVRDDDWCKFQKTLFTPFTMLILATGISIFAFLIILVLLVLRAVRHERGRRDEDLRERRERKDDQMRKMQEMSDNLEKTVKDLSTSEEAEVFVTTRELKSEMNTLKKSLSGYTEKGTKKAPEKKDIVKKPVKNLRPKPKEKEPKLVKMSEFGDMIGKTVIIDCTLKPVRDFTEEGFNILWFRINDGSEERLLSSYEKINVRKARMIVEVRKTGGGSVYALFKKLI